MLPSHSSADSNVRKGTKRKRSIASDDTESMQSRRKRETKDFVREGRWPCHPLVETTADQRNREELALQLGLHGISVLEVRELGLWTYLKSQEVNDPAVCSEARTILDTKLEEADMYQHLSFFRKMLPDCALSDMQSMLHHLLSAKAHAKRHAETQQVAETNTCLANPGGNTDDLLELYALFLERHAQRTCRVVERRLRCIQLKQELKEASISTEACGVMSRALGANSFMNEIWRIYGRPCNPSIRLHMRIHLFQVQRLPADCIFHGRPRGPYKPVSIAYVYLHDWLQLMSTVPRAGTAQTCLTGLPRKVTPRSEVMRSLPASAMLFDSTSSRRAEKKGKDALLKSKNGVPVGKGIEGKSTPPGLPAVSRPLLCTSHSTQKHRHKQHLPAPPPPPIQLQQPAPVRQVRDMRHHPGPRKPTHRYPPKEGGEKRDIKHTSTNRRAKAHQRRRSGPRIVCLIAWIKCC